MAVVSQKVAYAIYCLAVSHPDFDYDDCLGIAQNICDQIPRKYDEQRIKAFIELNAGYNGAAAQEVYGVNP